MPHRVHAVATAAIATLVALLIAGILPWLVGQVPLFGPARLGVYVTASVVLPIYVYALYKIIQRSVRRDARDRDHARDAVSPAGRHVEEVADA